MYMCVCVCVCVSLGVCVCVHLLILFTFDRNTTYGCSFQKACMDFYLVAFIEDS